MSALRHWLTEQLAERCALPPGQIDIDRPFREYGLRSREATALSGRLAAHLGRPLAPTLLWQHPTVRRLAAHLEEVADDGLEGTEGGPSPSGPAEGGHGGGAMPLAVVGAGCRLPGGLGSPAALWEFLRDGGDAVSELPSGRWEEYRGASPAHASVLDRTTAVGGFLDDVGAFDADFFGIPPGECAEMDPQQKLFLEVAWEALEHAGIPTEHLAGTSCGVFVGASGDDFARRRMEALGDISGWTLQGSALSVIANRLSYLLDLNGPSLTVDTACSSSLVAVHLAAQSLRTGESDLAIVGGVNVLLSPGGTVYADQAEASSPTGRCRPFDAAADGIVRAEGCVALVLKPYAEALRSGDRVLALLHGSAVNQDGRSNGLTAPSPSAQEALLRRAWHAAGTDPARLGYVEAHGTGTRLGDPIEAGALGRARGPAPRPLRIGSVKANFGHLEAAAGLAGTLKCVLALHHGRLPPTPHHHRAHPDIDFTGLGLDVVARLTRWDAPQGRRLAGVSSFGIGGTNAHAVLSDAP
ncbi:type I polyketide synthase [Streptomyces sp. NPDC048172]|uniref:type I polyketide synthase n=1 Tax=Streptomyces sp. NPDC048172 TaxID=3365505 RepID=UPI0037220510